MAARLAARIPKLWSLTSALRVCQAETPLTAPNRAITIGRDHVMLKHKSDHKSDHKKLDCFVGKWVEHERKNMDKVLDAAGIKGDAKKFFLKNKAEITYSRSGDKWTVKVGVVDKPEKMSFNFKLGEQFHAKQLDGSPMKSVIKQDGHKLVSHHEITGSPKYKMDIVKHVDGNKMHSVTTVKGVKMESHFKKH